MALPAFTSMPKRCSPLLAGISFLASKAGAMVLRFRLLAKCENIFICSTPTGLRLRRLCENLPSATMRDEPQTFVGVPAIEYVLGEVTLGVEELEARGLLETPAIRMREFGFQYVRVSRESPYALALQAARKLIENSRIDPYTVDAIYYVGATPDSHALMNGDPRSAFHYPVAQLQYELEMTRAAVLGVSQVGCAGLMAAVSLAGNFLLSNSSAERSGRVLELPIYWLLRTSDLAREGFENSGSYRFADHIYEDRPSGRYGVGQWLDSWLLKMPAVQAFRARYFMARDAL
jgi:hypothetical protein